MDKEKIFINGFESWYETFYEVVAEITQSINIGGLSTRIESTQYNYGRGGLYELAKELTDKFEEKNNGREWDGEFFDEIDEFLQKELYEETKT